MANTCDKNGEISKPYLELRLRFEDMAALELQERQSSKSLPLIRSSYIAGGPLTIPFADLFLRAPVRNQGDIIFNNTEFEEWSKNV